MPFQSLSAMIDALSSEIQAIRDRRGAAELTLTGGRLTGKHGDLYLYVFPLSEERSFKDDSPVEVIVGNEGFDATLVSCADGQIVIGVEEDLGERVERATLVVDDAFLIERLQEVLSEVRKDDVGGFSHSMARKVIGEESVRSEDAAPPRHVIEAQPPLNELQQAAVRRSLGSEVTYIWGPPGTGKTTVLARIAEALWLEGKRVLVVSNNNIAVDTLLEKIADRLATHEHDGLNTGKLIRFGPIQKNELEEKYGHQVGLERLVEDASRQLAAEREQLQERLTELKSRAIRLSSAVAAHEEHTSAQQRVASARRTLDAAEGRAEMLTAAVDDAGTRMGDLQDDLERAKGMSFLGRLVRRIDPERLQADLSAVRSQRSQTVFSLEELRGQISDLRVEAERAANALNEPATRVEELPSAEDCRAQLAAVEKSMSSANARLEAIEADLARIRERLVRQCRTLATTVYRTYLHSEISGLFDVVIIDEASVLMLPLAYYASGRASGQVIVTGDFRQLAPIVLTRDEESAAWLKTDVFAKSGIEQAVERRERPDALVPLRTQYRMRREICDLINTHFYDDQLETASSVEEMSIHRALGENALCYVDTSDLGPWAAYEGDSKSTYNVLHAIIAGQLIDQLRRSGLANDVGVDIALMTQFKAQRHLMQTLLDSQSSGSRLPHASTVHAFQGNERRAVLLEITQSQGVPLWGWIKDTDPGSDGFRLFNVALSRAQQNVVLIANFKYILGKLRAPTIGRRVLEHFVREGNEIPSSWFYPRLAASEVAQLLPDTDPSLTLDDGQVTVFDATSFYPAFLNDLRNAQESIVIFSPFMTEEGTGRWMDLLEAKVREGLEVRIVSSPPQGLFAEAGQCLIPSVRGADIALDERAGMHEKIAIIDGKILWHGSLNILSHRDTEESMLRIPSAETCARIAELVSTMLAKRRLRDIGPNAFAERENPACAACGAHTTLRRGRYGTYFTCNDCSEKINVRQAYRSMDAPETTEGPTSCPACGKPLVRKVGRYGPFLGCSSYPDCEFSRGL